MNTAVVAIDDTTIVREIESMPCVERVQCVWKQAADMTTSEKYRMKRGRLSDFVTQADSTSTYGHARQQIKLLNLDSLHAQGFCGEGMTIAVLDAGFYDATNLSYIDQEKILGMYDFAHASLACQHAYETHGTEVLSCMAANTPGSYVGSAPDAKFWLFVTEDVDSEYLIEEDYWVTAAERADSLGVDIINTSLGYTTFDDATMSYTHADLDGETAFISRAAGIAARKGMLVVTAAGNDYNKSWKKIAFPADAKGVVTVGSVNVYGQHSFFSSCGYTADERIKPDVMSMGDYAYAISAGNKIKCGSGTSYATPILCGALACLWQSHPEWSVAQLIDKVQRSASQYNNPDILCGYGVPDIYVAYRGASSIESINHTTNFYVAHKQLHLDNIMHEGQLLIYDTMGRCLIDLPIDTNSHVIRLDNLSAGIYIAIICHDNQQTIRKIIISQ